MNIGKIGRRCFNAKQKNECLVTYRAIMGGNLSHQFPRLNAVNAQTRPGRGDDLIARKLHWTVDGELGTARLPLAGSLHGLCCGR